jgi:hypothetical protein
LYDCETQSLAPREENRLGARTGNWGFQGDGSSNCWVFWAVSLWGIIGCYQLVVSTMKLEAVCCSKTLVTTEKNVSQVRQLQFNAKQADELDVWTEERGSDSRLEDTIQCGAAS